MSASDELPRGWVLPVTASVTPITATIPAAPGITHVLTDAILSGYISNVATASGDTLQMQSGSLTQNLLVWIVQAVASGSFTQLSEAWSGQIAGELGNALSVNAALIGTSSFWMLEIHGYDI